MTDTTLVPSPAEKAVLDSGCTSHLITKTTQCIDKIPTTNGLRVGIPNGQTMQATHNATLDLQHLPIPTNRSAQQASVQPGLKQSLISLGQLCDHGCDYILLDKHYASVIKDGVTSVIGLRNRTNGMWLVDVELSGRPTLLPNQHPTYQHQANSAYEQKTKVQLIDFLHRACFSPPISTWTQAIKKNFFATWPGLTADAVRKYLPKSLATAEGHLKAAPKNLRSTSKTRPTLAQTNANTAMTTPTSGHVQTHLVYAKSSR